MAKRLQPAAEMMGADIHADQTGWQGGKACFLATRPLLTQHDGAALVEANDVERVLPDIDADHSDCCVELLGHGVLLLPSAPCQL
jgi:hypothetical protein